MEEQEEPNSCTSQRRLHLIAFGIRKHPEIRLLLVVLPVSNVKVTYINDVNPIIATGSDDDVFQLLAYSMFVVLI